MKRRLLAAFFLWAATMAVTAQDMPTEQSARAVMVFNFLKFAELPSESAATAQRIRLCVAVGDPRQAEALSTLAGRKVRGRELEVVRFAERDNGCQVLYVDTRQRWHAVEEHDAFRQTLTISAYPGFARGGGMIEIDLQENGIRFDINLAEGRRAGIRFSPQLLRLARQLYE